MPNRPINMPWLTPYLCVKDADQSATFYQNAFGFSVSNKIPDADGKTTHVEMKYQDQIIVMLAPEGAYGSPAKTPATLNIISPIGLYTYCDNVDEIYDQALKAGAISETTPADMFWGDRMCRVICPNGYIWAFACVIGN